MNTNDTIYQAWPNDIYSTTAVALVLIVFFIMLTYKRKKEPNYEVQIRRSIQQLFAMATRKDYQAAASLLARSPEDVLRYSQEPEEVERRCQPLQEMASQGGIGIDNVQPRAENEWVCDVSVLGAQRVVTQQVWRWIRDRWALLESPGR